jgi:AraC-like DNA-binding protein
MNEEMWAIFEPQLNLRMSNLDQGSRFSDRVRVVLRDAIASGHYSKPEIASRLGISARTLQRRLREEGTTYRVVLDKLREDLALRYLAQSHYTSAQIGFLLGYDDPNSFFRAFRSWTGQTPEEVRATIT